MKNNLYHCFYSEEQKKACSVLDSDDCATFYELVDGRIVEITEARRNQDMSLPNFEDAIYLGLGKFHHIE